MTARGAFAGPILCLVTDRRQLSPDAKTVGGELAFLEAFLDTAVAAGIDLIQIRERDLDAAALVRLTRHVVASARGTSTRVIVNDRADVALAAGADGVHLRADGPPVARIRELGPAAWIVGRSVHDVAEVVEHAAADYLIMGTVFASGSKAPGSVTIGLDGLAAAARRAGPPLIAIGGVDPTRAGACLAAGASGVAAIGAFLPPGRAPGALGVAVAARAFRAAMTPGSH